MASLQKIDHVSALDDWLENPHEFGHLLGYDKLTETHGKWIKIFLKYKKFDVLQAHRGSYKTTSGIVAMILLFFCYPNMRLLIVRKTGDLASAILKTIQTHMLTSDVIRLYLYSRWEIVNASTKIWSSERTNFSFKRTITPDPSMSAVGVGASITGAHFDYIWSDDIVTIDDRYSAAERKWTIAYFQELDNLIDPLGQTRLSGTPWHESDVFSIFPKEIFEERQFPFGTVNLSENEMKEIAARQGRLPNSEWMCNYMLKHVEDRETLGAFMSVPLWDCQYCLAFIDSSFSEKKGTDRTSVAIVGVSKDLIIFTGMSWQHSIADHQIRIEMLDFLNIYTPIETVFESQLGDSTIFFIDAFKQDEAKYEVKNLWTWKHQSRNKHERIMATITSQKESMRILEGTQQAFSIGVSRYHKDVDHDDEADSLAGGVEALGTSEIIAEYVKALNILKRR